MMDLQNTTMLDLYRIRKAVRHCIGLDFQTLHLYTRIRYQSGRRMTLEKIDLACRLITQVDRTLDHRYRFRDQETPKLNLGNRWFESERRWQQRYAENVNWRTMHEYEFMRRYYPDLTPRQAYQQACRRQRIELGDDARGELYYVTQNSLYRTTRRELDFIKWRRRVIGH